MRLLVVLLVVLPALARAEALSELVADFTGDGVADRAVLVETTEGGEADLLIYAGLPGGGEALALRAPALVWVGGIGQQPSLDRTAGGSLQVISMNESIGRNRWRQTLTIAWRGGAFVLAGFTYSWYDTLDLDASGTCDVNLLTGRGVLSEGPEGARTSAAFRTDLRAMPVAEWPGNPPPECGLW